MKYFKCLMSIFLVVAMMCGFPGMTHIVSAVSHEKPSEIQTGNISPLSSDEISEQLLPGDILVQKDLNEICASGIITPGQLKLTAVNRSTTSANTTAAPDMMEAIVKTNLIFSLKNTINESIDVNTGSVNISYNLASMAGINGMDLMLDLRYSSLDSNTLDKGYFDYDTVTNGFSVTYIKDSVYTYGTETTHVRQIFTQRVASSEYGAFLDYLSGGPYILQNPEGYPMGTVESYDFDYLTDSYTAFFVFNHATVEKPTDSANNGLSTGWHFGIPYIKQISAFDEDGNPDNSYKTLVLDTGKSFSLQNDYLLDTNEYEDNVFYDTGAYPGYDYISSFNVNFNQITVAHILSYKDGTKYYFDSNDRCIGKEDRFGNKITYEYDSQERLSAIRDDFGRYIMIEWGTNSFVVSSSDGAPVTVSLSNGNITSIAYNETEVSSFSYVTRNANFSDGITYSPPSVIPYVLLSEITHPNSSKTTYEYVKYSARRPDFTYDDVFRVKERYDTVNGSKQNTFYYTYGGCYLDDYSDYENIALTSTLVADSIWTAQDLTCDVYTILSNYSTRVSDGTKQMAYHFNTNGHCSRIETWEENILVQSVEFLYAGDAVLAERELLMDSAEDAVVFFTIYTNDMFGNILQIQKYQSRDIVHYIENAEYQNPYHFMTSSTVENIHSVYTYSTDGKTLTSKKVYENNVLREQTDYTYDTRGNVLTEKFYILPSGQTVTTTYSYADNLTRAAGLNFDGLFCTSVSVSGIKDSDGATKANVTTSATYDAAGRALSSVDANGNTTSYAYDARGRLIRTDYPDGTYETITYDIPNNRATTRNRAGYVQISLYDVKGNVVSVTEGTSSAMLSAYTYDAIGRLSTERKYHTATTYSETRYTYDALDRVLSVNVYDEAGALLSSETNVYDVVLLNGTAVQKVTNAVLGDTNAPSIVTAQYTDAYGRTIQASKTFEQDELAKTYEYDALDRLVKETDENGHSTQYTYNYAGKALTVTDALGAVLTYTYDSMGNVLTMTDALGNTVTYTYDVLGRLLTQSVPFDVGSAQITKYDYDGNGNLTMTRITNNAVGESTSYSKTVNTYDSMNRMVSTVSYDGTVAALTNNYTYNAYDKVQTMTSGGVTTTYTYNTRGEQTKVTDALNQNETYTYDLGGNLLTKTDRNGTTFTYTYDRLGRLLSETARNGSKTEQKTYTYSMSGALISEADGDVTITRKYDCLGRLIEETETANNKNAVSRYAYTKTDERERYTQVYQNETILSEYYEYDAVGRLVKVYTSTAEWQTNDGTESSEDDDGGSDSDDPDPYDFDSYPNLKTYTIKYGDGSRMCDFKLVPMSGTTLDFPVTYTIENVPYGVCFSDDYWALDVASGRLYSSSWGYEGEYLFTYFDENGVEDITEHFYVIATPTDFSEVELIMSYYIYDGTKIVNSIGIEIPKSSTDPVALWMYIEPGEYIFFVPNLYSTMTSTDSTETLITTYGYDANGNRISMTNANGTSTTYAYNKANLVTTVQNMSGEVVLSSHTYTYYLDGNIKTEIIDGETKSYEYDGLGRLTREVKSGILSADDIVYTYDARGNRATRTQGPATTTYTYDANNRLLAETTGVSNTLYTYDANGNTLSAMKDGTLVYSYTYGLFGTQDSYTNDAILYTYYTYRPDGLRHSIGDTVHVWDGANIVADVEGNDITTYFRGINLIYAEEDGDITFYHFNAHGDVVVLTNESGEKEKTYSYTSFGIEYNPSTLDDNPFRYCGEYYDIESGNIYLRARYYNSDLGRFTQQDGWEFANPEDPLSLNLYTYCWNNPIMFVDPSGCVVEVCFSDETKPYMGISVTASSDGAHVFSTQHENKQWFDGTIIDDNSSNAVPNFHIKIYFEDTPFNSNDSVREYTDLLANRLENHPSSFFGDSKIDRKQMYGEIWGHWVFWSLFPESSSANPADLDVYENGEVKDDRPLINFLAYLISFGY